MHAQQPSLCGGHVVWDICILQMHSISAVMACTMWGKDPCEKTLLSLETLNIQLSPCKYSIIYNWWVLLLVGFLSTSLLTERYSLCCWDLPHLTLSVLCNDRGRVGRLTTLGSSLQRQLAPGGAIELCGGMWKGSFRRVGPSAGEGPGGTILCTWEEPNHSPGLLHLCAPKTGALPRQAERSKYSCS